MKKQKQQDVFYVGIRDPMEVRRNLLESARDAIQFLKRSEKLKTIRAEKMHSIVKLGGQMRELRRLMLKLRQTFPATKVMKVKAKHSCAVCGDVSKNGSSLKQHMKKHGTVKNTSEVDELESELADIEGKLDRLN